MRSNQDVVLELQLCLCIPLQMLEIYYQRVFDGENCIVLQMLVDAVKDLSRYRLIQVVRYLQPLVYYRGDLEENVTMKWICAGRIG